MRKISVLLATLGLVLAGALFPMSAQASTACDTAWHNATSGNFYAFDFMNCSGKLGSTTGNDSSWSDSSGGFQGSDGNKAHSLLHKGTSGMAVKVYSGVSYQGNWSCIKKSEFYVSQLYGDYLTGGSGSYQAWNSISSHKWVREADCGTHFLH
ncbi:hypothetical protein ACFT2C_15165 [Promicromonospora sp. NPDC057138]|uniref:hypothetical protein n=1 Tax=Promicromonospora sp. NPDC057138 TaxID=3346031 RepID=UPI0036336B4D